MPKLSKMATALSAAHVAQRDAAISHMPAMPSAQAVGGSAGTAGSLLARVL